MVKRTAVPDPKPTVPAPKPVANPPKVIVPDPPTPAEIETLLTSADVRPPKPIEPSPLVTALRELLDAAPVDISTCTGVSPKALARYIAARSTAATVLATEK